MRTRKSNRSVSRREFLRLATIGGTAAVLAACAPPTPPPPVKETVVVKETVPVTVKETVPVTVKETVQVEKPVEKVVTATPRPAPAKVAYIRFLTQETDPMEVETYRKMIADFEAKNPDIRIELQLTGPDQIYERMVAALVSGVTALDMLQPNPAMAFLLGAKGYLAPIDDVVAEVGGDSFFYDNSVLKWEGKRYGVPFGGGTALIWYRKDLFQADGISVPKTWEELEAAVKHFTKKFNPTSPTTYGITLPYSQQPVTQWYAQSFWWSNGAEHFDKDLNIVTDSPETYEFLDFYARMFQYVPEASTGYSWGDMIDGFIAGNTAMTIYLGRVLGRVYTSAPQLVGKVGVFEYPKRKLRVTTDDPNYYIISSKSPYVEQCKRWLKYTLVGQPSYDFLCSVPAHLPPATTDQLKWWNQDKTGCKMLDDNVDIKKAFGDVVPYAYNPIANSGGIIEGVKQKKETYVPTGVANPFIIVTEGSTQYLAQMIQNVVVKKMSPRDAVKAVVPEMDKTVKQAMQDLGWKK